MGILQTPCPPCCSKPHSPEHPRAEVRMLRLVLVGFLWVSCGFVSSESLLCSCIWCRSFLKSSSSSFFAYMGGGCGGEWWVSVCVFGFVCVRAHIIWFAISFFCSSRTLSFLISFSMRLCDLSFSYESYAVSSRLAGSGDDQQAGRQAGRTARQHIQAGATNTCCFMRRRSPSGACTRRVVVHHARAAAEGRRHKIVERLDWMDLSCGFRGLRCPILQTHTHHNKQQKTNTRSIPPTQYNNSHRLPPCVASRARRGCKKGGQAGARRPAAWIEGEDPATGVLLVQRHR